MSRKKIIDDFKNDYPDAYKAVDAMINGTILDAIRKNVVVIGLFIMTIVAAFEAGMLYEGQIVRNLQRQMTVLERNVSELSGRTAANEAILRKIGK